MHDRILRTGLEQNKIRNEKKLMAKYHIQTAAYYFPNYHVDPRNEAIHGTGWTEWELMKCARSRFDGHQQPKVPVWGYEDESRSEVMAKKIDAAADSGLDAFIFDWYWYDGPYLERALNDGFLQASNRERLKFALMWANHDWKNFHPGGRDVASYPINFEWTTTRDNVGEVWDYIIEHYLTQPNYWRINGAPYFSIYAVNRFISQMGGVNAAADVIDLLREKARKAGLKDVHVNGIWFDVLDSNPRCSECPQSDWISRVGLNSYTSYNNVCVSPKWASDFPRVDTLEIAEDYLKICRKAQTSLPGPYYPVVTVGWDSSPRAIQSETFEPPPCYPYLPVMEMTPEWFGQILAATVDCLKDQPEEQRILFFNAWNEWTEGSYLEPDLLYGDAMLRIMKKELAG